MYVNPLYKNVCIYVWYVYKSSYIKIYAYNDIVYMY